MSRLTPAYALLSLLLSLALPAMAQGQNQPPQAPALEQRRITALQLALERPFPKPACPTEADPGNSCIWGKLGYAIAALSLARSETEVKAGNTAVREALATVNGLPQDMAVRARTPRPNKKVQPTDRLVFFTAGLIERLYFQFGDKSPTPGRLDPANMREIETLMWDHARHACRVREADPTRTWHYPGSENIGLFHSTTCWGMAEILSANPTCSPCTYDDGSTLHQQLQAWTKYLSEYIRQRARYGGLVEFFSPTYYKYTLQNFYNLADFSSDSELRRLASSFLDVWWAEWAQEQVGGWHGGSKSRAYDTEIESQSVGRQLGWVYFGLGNSEAPGLMVSMAASPYQPPPIVGQIASNAAKRTGYVVQAQAGGLVTPTSARREIDGAAGGVVRYAYVTSSFVLALSEVPRISWERWIPFARQNQWGGLTLVGPGRPQYVFARPLLSGKNRSSYNDLWGVQSYGTQIVQKIPAPLSRNVGRMAVWLSNDLKTERDGEWTITTWGDSFVAFRPAFGDIDRNSAADKLVMNDDTAPVIIQAALKSEFSDLTAFKSALRSATLEVRNEFIRFRGLGKAGTLTFFYKSDRAPEIDGKPLDFSPPFSFDSPFLKARWGEGVVTIRYGQQELIRDFR